MTQITLDTEVDHIDLLLEVIKKYEHLLTKNQDGVDSCNFSSRAVISKNIEFLKAIQNEMGGEIFIDKNIGSFLHFE